MLDSLKPIWNRLTVMQRAGIAAVMLVVFGGIMLAVNNGQGGSYGVLFSNLEPQDAGEVVDKLRELKVEYRLTQGGKAIEVPDDRVLDLRLSLASEGLPGDGVVGLEAFDKPQFGATELTQQVLRLRGLQGELVRTIKSLDGVKEARVHIAMPERRLFQDNENPTTASVVVHLGRGHEIPQKQIAGIVHLVAAAVEGLKPENVSVHDAQGELLSGDRDEINLTSTQIQVQEQYERRLASQLTNLAQEALGPDKAAIKVHAEFDWDQAETSREVFQAAGRGGKGIPIEETSDSESYTRTDAAPAIGGVPGVTPATPATAAAAASPAPVAPAGPAAAPNGPGGYLKTRGINRYAVNRTVERRTTAPGKLKRLSVAVLLDSSINTTQQAALKTTFAAAAGLDLSANGRGDVMELLPMAFDRTAETKAEEAEKAAAKVASAQLQTRNYAAVGIVVALVIASLLLTLRLRSPRRPKLDATVGEPLPATYGPQGAAAQADGSEAAPTPSPGGGQGRQPAPHAGEMVLPPLDLARKLASERPEEVARQLELWMAEA